MANLPPFHRGISELEEQTRLVLKKLGFKKEQPRKTSAVKIAFVGKPNVGKSSLINSLLGKDRLIVSEKPGTTIDATDTPFKAANGSFILIDTAGIRKRGKVGLGIERYGHLRALRAIARCDVACLIVDFERGVTHQDLHVGQYILDAGKGLMILVNKSDLMEDPHKEQQNFLNELHYRLAFIPWAPVLFASAATKKNLFKIFETAQNIQNERMKSIADGEFGTFIKATVLMHPPKRSGKRVIIKNGKQTDTCPPTFTFSSNEPDLVHFSYRRFLENEIRRKYGFFGTVIILNFV
ncbi:50S ribosome-binding GTPase [Candidatus Peregrinibacteria bacterium]|nr:50S ribosome-binding GTPase [Candidatus Peregrinibacteria bacterium]